MLVWIEQFNKSFQTRELYQLRMVCFGMDYVAGLFSFIMQSTTQNVRDTVISALCETQTWVRYVWRKCGCFIHDASADALYVQPA